MDPIATGQAILCLEAEKYAGENQKLSDSLREIIMHPNYGYGLSEEGIKRWKIEKGNSEEFSDIKDLIYSFFLNQK